MEKGSQLADYSRIKARQAYVFDLSGEIGNAALAAPTLLSFQINVIGKKSHAGFCPQLGVNAIEIAAAAISQIKQGWTDEETTGKHRKDKRRSPGEYRIRCVHFNW